MIKDRQKQRKAADELGVMALLTEIMGLTDAKKNASIPLNGDLAKKTGGWCFARRKAPKARWGVSALVYLS